MNKEVIVKGNILGTLRNMIHLYKFNNRGIDPDTVMIPYWLYDRLLIEGAKQIPTTVLDVVRNKVYGFQLMVVNKGYRATDGEDINTITVLSMFKNMYEEKLHLLLDRTDWDWI